MRSESYRKPRLRPTHMDLELYVAYYTKAHSCHILILHCFIHVRSIESLFPIYSRIFRHISASPCMFRGLKSSCTERTVALPQHQNWCISVARIDAQRPEILNVKQRNTFRISPLPYETRKFILWPSNKKIVYTTTDAYCIILARATLAALLRSAQKLALAENHILYVLGE